MWNKLQLKMRKKLIYVYFTSLLLCASGWSQQSAITKAQDSTRLNNSYGLRLGLDLQNIVTSLTNKNFQGIEIMGDYRLSKKYYLAAELGNQEKTINETNISTTTKGSYLKAGIDYNAYKNLVGLRNLIFVGLRYGYANYSQELNRFSIATQDNFFGVNSQISDLKSEGLSAHWLELIAGVKAEIFKNVFVGFSVSIQRNISDEKPDGFDNLYIPGYGTTNDFGEISAGYRYFISYYIPLYKKKTKNKKEVESTSEN